MIESQLLFQRLRRAGSLAEDALLIVMLTVMIALAALQIFMRNIFDTGFVWADELLRIQVLWIALLGAVAASRDDNHVNIDLLTRFLPGRWQQGTKVMVDLFTALICALIAWESTRFVQMEQAYGSTVLGNFPAWIVQSILPVGFAIIAYRYFLFFCKNLGKLLKGVSAQ
jgi:TRAP-type C4-dicarboxylate transport system permease small subunit